MCVEDCRRAQIHWIIFTLQDYYYNFSGRQSGKQLLAENKELEKSLEMSKDLEIKLVKVEGTTDW